ncbi:unnamed protein product [Haemonchus placei]|uniref:Uncharacterized protein n=1 Tax=Haemonchus placei TaxID=6290 RepID=A0A0N4WSZ1_HAEPC|nr:unnamed protein product [Haemonchus placei]
MYIKIRIFGDDSRKPLFHGRRRKLYKSRHHIHIEITVESASLSLSNRCSSRRQPGRGFYCHQHIILLLHEWVISTCIYWLLSKIVKRPCFFRRQHIGRLLAASILHVQIDGSEGTERMRNSQGFAETRKVYFPFSKEMCHMRQHQ